MIEQANHHPPISVDGLAILRKSRIKCIPRDINCQEKFFTSCLLRDQEVNLRRKSYRYFRKKKRKNLTRLQRRNTFKESEFEELYRKIFERRYVMRKTSILVLSFLLMAGVVTEALGSKIGLGGFAGMNIPVAQEDAGTSSLFGFKARLGLIPRLGFEAFFTKMSQGDADVEVWGKDMSMEGGSINSFGLNLILGSMSSDAGAHFHFAGGIGSYSLSKEGVPDESRFGYSFGPGLEIGLGKMSIEISSKAHIIPLDGGGSRKNIGISGGLNYYFGLGDTY